MRQAATREPTVSADVATPLLQAVVTGAFGGIAGATIGYGIGQNLQGVLLGAGTGGVVVSGAAWCVLLWDHRRLLWATERAIHQDLDGDGKIGPRRLTVEASYHDIHGRLTQMEYLTIDSITEKQLIEFAREVTANKRTLAVAYWTRTGSPFSRGQFDAMMAELIRIGWVRDNGHGGRELSAAGRVMLGKIAVQHPTTPLPA